MASGVWDDVSHEYTCFIRRGEGKRLHGYIIRYMRVHHRTLQVKNVFPIQMQACERMRKPIDIVQTKILTHFIISCSVLIINTPIEAADSNNYLTMV